MIKRTFHLSIRLFLEIVAVIIAGFLILLGGFIYRISQSPIKINFLKTYVQDSFKSINPNLIFGTEDVYLSLEDSGLKVTLDNVYFIDGDSSVIDAKSVGLTFSVKSIIQKIPASIEMEEASFLVSINESGKINVAIGENENSNATVPVTQRASKFLSDERFSSLKQISFLNSNLFIINDASEDSWNFENIDMIFKRSNNNIIIGEAAINFEGEDLGIKSVYNIATGKSKLSVNFNDINVASFYNKYDKFQNFDMTLKGELSLDLNEKLQVKNINLEGEIKEGSSITLSQFFDESLDVKGVFDFRYKDKKATSEKLELNIAGIDTVASLELDLTDEGIIFYSNLKNGYFPISKGEYYWPKSFAAGAKKWITSRLTDGKVDYAETNLKGIINNETGNVLFDEINGYIDFSDMTVNFLDSMKNIQSVSGRAAFDKEAFDILIKEGRIEDVNVQEGSKVHIPFKNVAVDVDVLLKGNASTVAEIINDKPLGYMDRIKILPEELSGDISGILKMNIPVSGKGIKVDVEANLNEVSVKDLIWGQDLENAIGVLKVDNEKLNINAYGVFDKAKLTINWNEFFNADAEYDRVAEIDGILDIKLLKEMNILDLTKIVDGDILASGLYKSKNGTGTVFAKSNLVGTAVDFPLVPYKKDKETAADLELLIKLEDNKFRELDNIKLTDIGMTMRGWYNSEILYLSELTMPENDINISGYYEAFYDRIPNVDISGRMGTPVMLKVVPQGDINTIKMQADDFGAVLKSLKLWDKMNGGLLTLDGKSSTDLSILDGRLVIDNFNVVNMDALTTMLGAMSLDGLSNALNGDGIKFDKLAADFTWDYNKGQFIFKDGKTSGAALGLTFDNIWDMKNNTIAMKGTVAPLEGINNAVKNIPIIGRVLTGANQEGIFGARYTVKGPLSKPEVDVKGASSLTPGILRDIFFSGENLEKTIEKENQKKEADEELKESIEKEEELNELRGIK